MCVSIIGLKPWQALDGLRLRKKHLTNKKLRERLNNIESFDEIYNRLDGCPIIWRSKPQTLVSVSMMEAEYIALSMCMRELIPLKWIFVDLSNCFEVDVKVTRAKCTVFEDNILAIQFANRWFQGCSTLHYIIIYFVSIYEREASAWSMYQRICRLQTC